MPHLKQAPYLFLILDEEGPTVPKATDVASAEWVHDTEWKEPEKSAEAVEMKARLKIDRAPA